MATTVEPETTTERWVYVGLRQLSTGTTLGSAWLDETGTVLLYKKVTGSAIGSTYEVQVDRRDGTQVLGQPTYLGRAHADSRPVNDEDRVRWEVATQAARTAQARARLEANDAKSSAIDDALAPLTDLARGMRTTADRRALIALVIQHIERNAW